MPPITSIEALRLVNTEKKNKEEAKKLFDVMQGKQREWVDYEADDKTYRAGLTRSIEIRESTRYPVSFILEVFDTTENNQTPVASFEVGEDGEYNLAVERGIALLRPYNDYDPEVLFTEVADTLALFQDS